MATALSGKEIFVVSLGMVRSLIRILIAVALTGCSMTVRSPRRHAQCPEGYHRSHGTCYPPDDAPTMDEDRKDGQEATDVEDS